MTTFLLELRTLAMREPDVLARKLLRDGADDIEAAMVAFAACPTMETLGRLNCAWSKAWRRYTLSEGPTGDDGGGRGAKRPAEHKRTNARATRRKAA